MRPGPVIVDGNEACASVANRAGEVIAICALTPASPMGDLADAWSSARRPNLFAERVPREILPVADPGPALHQPPSDLNAWRGGGQ